MGKANRVVQVTIFFPTFPSLPLLRRTFVIERRGMAKSCADGHSPIDESSPCPESITQFVSVHVFVASIRDGRFRHLGIDFGTRRALSLPSTKWSWRSRKNCG